MSNDYTSSLNISYDTLMSCSLYELQYWCDKAREKMERAEALAEKNK